MPDGSLQCLPASLSLGSSTGDSLFFADPQCTQELANAAGADAMCPAPTIAVRFGSTMVAGSPSAPSLHVYALGARVTPTTVFVSIAGVAPSCISMPIDGPFYVLGQELVATFPAITDRVE